MKVTYALADGSPFKGKAADGRDPGAVIPVLLAAVEGVRTGNSRDSAR